MVQHSSIDHSGVMSYASNANSTSAANYGGAAPTVSRGDHIHLSTGGSGIPETLLDAPGDIIVASAADTAGRLAIGADKTALVSNGTTASWGPGAATSYTPALTAATTNPTLGTGSVVAGHWLQIGKLVVAWGSISFGSSGTNAGSGEYWISLPATAISTSPRVMGTVTLYDSSSSTFKIGNAYYISTTVFRITNENVAGSVTVSEAAPWAWGASDALIFQLMYEAA